MPNGVDFANGTLCRGCGRPMLSAPTWRRKPELRPGHVRHNGGDLCATCYSRAYRAGTLPSPAPRRRARATRPAAVRVTATYGARCERHGVLADGLDTREAARRLAERHREVCRIGA